MNARDRRRFEAALLELRRRFTSQGEQEIEPNRPDPSARVDEDVQALNEMNQAIASRHNRTRAASLGKVDAALSRLRDEPEDFGLCLDCEEPIAARRLELMPFSEYCIGCQGKRDEPRGGARRKITDYVG